MCIFVQFSSVNVEMGPRPDSSAIDPANDLDRRGTDGQGSEGDTDWFFDMIALLPGRAAAGWLPGTASIVVVRVGWVEIFGGRPVRDKPATPGGTAIPGSRVAPLLARAPASRTARAAGPRLQKSS